MLCERACVVVVALGVCFLKLQERTREEIHNIHTGNDYFSLLWLCRITAINKIMVVHKLLCTLKR